ncbi:MAG TPA: TIGR03435 family protein [Terriglobia bacterium]|jgi:hypothetical protein
MRYRNIAFAFPAIMFVVYGAAHAQSARPQFEVASVKTNKSGGPPGILGTEGNRFIAENYPIVLLIQRAYGFPDEWLTRDRLIGGPGWIQNDRFDIEAKIEGDPRAIPNEQVWLMVRSLLEDRFQLKVHHETREFPVFNLLVANGGLKMKLSSDQTPPKSDEEVATFDPASPPRGETAATRTPSGDFDFRLEFVPDELSGNPDISGPTIFTALQEQLGLKLESGKAPVDVLVIDSIQRPSEN